MWMGVIHIYASIHAAVSSMWLRLIHNSLKKAYISQHESMCSSRHWCIFHRRGCRSVQQCVVAVTSFVCVAVAVCDSTLQYAAVCVAVTSAWLLQRVTMFAVHCSLLQWVLLLHISSALLQCVSNSVLHCCSVYRCRIFHLCGCCSV